MIIGIVSRAPHPTDYYRTLFPQHTLLYFQPEKALHGDIQPFDSVVIDGVLMQSEPALVQRILQRIRTVHCGIFSLGAEDIPCVVRHDRSGNLQLLCGRV